MVSVSACMHVFLVIRFVIRAVVAMLFASLDLKSVDILALSELKHPSPLARVAEGVRRDNKFFCRSIHNNRFAIISCTLQRFTFRTLKCVP